jgi:hypothetical protein
MTHGYDYQSTLEASQQVDWRIEDIIGGDKQLDFSKPFMPEALARTAPLAFLTAEEKLKLNQVRGGSYLYIFGLVEEFILPFVMDHARPHLGADNYRTRAFLQFASEEAKHIHLFKRFKEDFDAGFGVRCNVIGPPKAIAEAVLAHHPLAVALVTLHIEWMTQRHYTESVRDDIGLDPQFKSLLKHHWMEEAQHARLDTLMVETLAADCSTEDVRAAMDDYLKIGGLLDKALKQQVAFDLDALARASGRRFTEPERTTFLDQQLQANRWTYLGSGMTHANFLRTLETLGANARETIEAVSPAFC